MTNQEHLNILNQGVEAWDLFRRHHRDIQPDFSRANLSGADLREASLHGADLNGADLSKANLSGAYFMRSSLSGANLSGADLSRADLWGANLNGADLSKANLSGAYLREAHIEGANLSGADLSEANLLGASLISSNLSKADLSGADLSGATLMRTILSGATLTNCKVYGISAWDIQLNEAKQDNLIITPENEPVITVDNLKIAQFIYLLLNNREIREVIDTIATKAVLILGRFTPERKAVLDALRKELRLKGYLPIMFDFDKPSSQDVTETVSTLAHLARFIIVDLTDPSSTPYEIGTIASDHIKPIQSVFQPSDDAKRVFAMFKDLRLRYHWVLPPYQYQDQESLLTSLQEKVIAPAEQKVQELEAMKAT